MTRVDVRPTVRQLEEQAWDGWDDSVRGRIEWRTLFSADLTPTEALTAGIAEVEPGGWLGLHRHTPAEICYVIEGHGAITIEGKEFSVGPGSAFFIPADVEHGLRNEGPEALRFVYVFPTDSFGEIEYRFSERGRSEA